MGILGQKISDASPYEQRVAPHMLSAAAGSIPRGTKLDIVVVIDTAKHRGEPPRRGWMLRAENQLARYLQNRDLYFAV